MYTQMSGLMPRRGRNGKRIYLPLAGATKEAGIVRARTSVLRRQNTVTQFIATRPILGLCEVTERRGGDTGPPTMVGATRDRMEAGEGTERKRGGSSGTQRRNCRQEDDNGDTRIGKGNGGGGITGGQWLQWG